MPECLVCKIILEYDDLVAYGTDGIEEEIVIMHNIGHCPKCGKKYRWKDIYKYSHSEDVEEV